MSQLKASQLVSTLLEDLAGDYEERAGGKKDMWRQGGFSKFSLKGKNFGGKRPGEKAAPKAKDEDEDEDEKPEPKTNPRFSWKPKNESLLHELGGYYCATCKEPTTGVWDTVDGKLKCEKCNSDLNDPKSNSLRSREATHQPTYCAHCAPPPSEPALSGDAAWDEIIADERRLFGAEDER